MKRLTMCCLLLAMIGQAACLTAQAQGPVKLEQVSPFTFEPEWRVREEAHLTNDFNGGHNSDPDDAINRMRVGVRYKDKSGLSLFLQPQFAYDLTFNTGKHSNTVTDTDFHQGFLQWNRGGQMFRVGRQELAFGDERLVGASGWGAVGRSFDAARWTLTNQHGAMSFFAGRLGQASAKTTNPALLGFYSTLAPNKRTFIDIYALYKADNVANKPQGIYTIGTHPHLTFGKGFDANMELAAQGGHTSGRSLAAWAYSTNLGYTFPGKSALRVAVEKNFASGGDASGKGAVHTFDQLFPTNHAFYGMMDYMGWRNMDNWRLSLSAKVSPRLSANVDGHFFSLADARDYWYGDGGKAMNGSNGKPLLNKTGSGSSAIGSELDLTFNYALSKQLGLQFGMGYFAPGAYVRQNNQGHADSSHWFFIQPTYRF